MDLALYAPALGYYSAGATKLGQGGDFVTAPELTPLFGATLARQVAQVLNQGGGEVLEIGAGSGRLAVDILSALEELGTLPACYRILELSADLADRQRQTVASLPVSLRARVEWISALPDEITGVVLGNELLDALPVHLLSNTASGLCERGVAATGHDLVWADRALVPGPLAERAQSLPLPAPYVTEIGAAAEALVDTLARRLRHGVLLFIDYGFGASEYYHPQRAEGTLMCHYRHRAHADPFFLPGLQDITAHVDFTAMARAGVAAGLKLAGYTSQARFLANLGITDLLARLDPGSVSFARSVAPVQKLLSPAEMGELFKVIALSAGLAEPLMGFRAGSLDRLL